MFDLYLSSLIARIFRDNANLFKRDISFNKFTQIITNDVVRQILWRVIKYLFGVLQIAGDVSSRGIINSSVLTRAGTQHRAER